MFNYESFVKFVNGLLVDSAKYPEYAGIYKSQAFGALRFVTESCYKTNPELETAIISMWESVWKEQFEAIQYG